MSGSFARLFAPGPPNASSSLALRFFPLDVLAAPPTSLALAPDALAPAIAFCFFAPFLSAFFAFFPSVSAAASAAASGGNPLATASSTLRFRVLFQWFLIALSVRPTNVFAISAHLFPYSACATMSFWSSSLDHSSRLISGLRWLYHRSRHCFPILPGSCCAILLHCFAPSALTSSMILSSSSFVHGPFTSSGLRTFCQRCRHWTSVRSSKYSAIFFQFLPL
mmetsp:Transcript_138076/g.335613  ORF Transcript_138076/g.335613 Transcript_138076/m.335613 type:complete len:222 (+) Transcript_138076:222-887(+)